MPTVVPKRRSLARVAFDCTQFRRGEVGGYEGGLLNLLDGIVEVQPADLEITLFVLASQRQHFAPYAEHFAIRSVAVSGVVQRTLWQNLVLPFYSSSYDAMVFTANVRPLLLFCKSITVVYDLQHIHFPEYFPRGMLLNRRIFVPPTVRRSDAVMTISDTIREEIREQFGRSDVRPCYMAVAFERETAREAAPPGLPDRFLLVPSLLSPHKNIENLCAALRMLADDPELPDFVFIGAFRREDFTYEVPRDRVHVLGYVAREVRDYLLAHCAGLVLPSRYEGFGMPYAEAVLAGKPLVASDIPIAREVLGDDAVFIEAPYGAPEIAAALQRFVHQPAAPPSAEAVARVEERTLPANVARRYLALIREVIGA